MAEATPTSEADLVLVRQALQDAESSLKDTREKLSQTEKKLQDEAAARKRAEADAQKEKMDNMHRMQQDQQEKITSPEASVGSFLGDGNEKNFEDRELAITAAQYLNSKCKTVLDEGHYSQARPLLEECYMIRKKFLYGEPITADTLYMLAEIHRKSGDLTLALETLKNTLELQVLLFGMLCEQSALCIHSTAEIKLTTGCFSEAFTLFNDNLARRIETVGNVGAALAGLSRVKLAQGKVQEALDFAEQSYKLRIKQHKGLKNVEVVDSLFCKSRVELARGDNETAKILAEQGLANLRFCTRETSPAVALALMQVGETLHPAGRYAEALEKFDQAKAMIVNFLGECNHMVPTIQIHRAKTLLTLGKFKDSLLAIEDASRIISALGKRKDAGNLLPADLAHVYGHYYKYIGNFLKASESYKDALTKYNDILQDTSPTEHKSHPTVAVILLDLADTERIRGLYEEAESYITTAEVILRETMGIENFLYAYYYQCLGDWHISRGTFDEAEKYLRRAFNQRKTSLPEVHYDVAITLNSQGECARKKFDYSEADEFFEKALEICRATVGEDHILAHVIMNNKALLYAMVNSAEVCDLDVFSTDPNDPCPVCDCSGFIKAAGMICQSAVFVRTMFEDIDHPLVTNMCGNVGLVKQMEVAEKNRFSNKLSKTHRAEYKRVEENGALGANNPQLLYKEIEYKDSKTTVNDAIRKLRDFFNFPMEHHWIQKFVLYSIEEAQQDEMTVAMNIVREGDNFSKIGRYKASDDKYEIALELFSGYLGKDVWHPAVASLLLSMANNFRIQARFTEARVLYQRSLSMFTKLYGSDSYEAGTAYFGIGEFFIALMRPEEARGYIEMAEQSWVAASRSAEDKIFTLAKLRFIEVDFISGLWNEAFEKMKEVLPKIEANLDDLRRVEAHILYGRILLALGKFSEAQSALNVAIEKVKAFSGDSHPTVAKAKMYLAMCSFESCSYELSLSQIGSALYHACKFFGITDEKPSSKSVEDLVRLSGPAIEDEADDVNVEIAVSPTTEAVSNLELEASSEALAATVGATSEALNNTEVVLDELDLKSSSEALAVIEGAISEVSADNASKVYRTEASDDKELSTTNSEKKDSKSNELQLEQEKGPDPNDPDYVFLATFPKEIFAYDKYITKAHPLLAEILIVKSYFMMTLISHLHSDIEKLLAVASKMNFLIFGTKDFHSTVANIATARLYYIKGDLNACSDLLDPATDNLGTLLGTLHPVRLDALVQVAEIKHINSQFRDSEVIYREVLVAQLELFGEHHPKCLASYCGILTCLLSLGMHTEAKDIVNKINFSLSNLYAQDINDPVIAKCYRLFGEFANIRGLYDAAAAYMERSISMYVSLYGDNDHTVATCLFSLAIVYQMQGRLLESKKIIEQCLEIREQRLNPSHLDMSKTLHSLGNCYAALGMYDRALSLYIRALKISRELFKSFANSHHADILSAIGDVFLILKYRNASDKFLTISSKMRLQLFDTNHPEVASSMFSLNNVAILEGDIDKAIRGHEEVLDIRRNVIGQMHRDVAKSLNSLGLCLLEKGQYLEARSMLERSLSMRKKLLGNEHPDVGESLHSLGLVYIAQGKCEDAMVLLERALANRRTSLGSRHPLVAETLCSIADVHNTQRSILAAYDCLVDSLKIRRAVFGNDSLVTAESLVGIAHNLHISGVYTSRLEVLKKLEDEENEAETDAEKAQKHAAKLKFPLDDSIDLLDIICSGDPVDLSDVQSISLENLFENSASDNFLSSDNEHLETEFIDKTSFISAQYSYNLVFETRTKWLTPEHPLVIEIMHAMNVNNLQAGKVADCREQSELILFLRRKVFGERHPSIILSYLDLAMSLRMLHILTPKKTTMDDKTSTDLKESKPKIDSRRPGPTLIEQLSTALDTQWETSISAMISSEPQLPPLIKKKKKLDRTQPIGYMGYAYPERKPLFEQKEPLKFGKVKKNDALWLLDAALELYKEIFIQDENPLLSTILFEKAELLRSQRNTDSARKILETCMDIRRRVLRNGHPGVADCINAIAENHRIDNESRLAEPMYQSALEVRIKECGSDHPSVADTLYSLGMLYFAKGQYATSRVYYNKSLEIRKRILGDEHPSVAQVLNSLAGLLHLEGEMHAAEGMYKEAITIKEKSIGALHPDYASALNNLGLLLKSKGIYTEAKALYEKAISIQEAHYGEIHPDIAASLNNLAALYFATDDLKSSKILYQKSIEIKQRVLGLDHPSVAAATNNLAGLLYTSGELTESLSLFKESLRIRKSIYGEMNPLVAESMNNLSIVYLTQGNSEQSHVMYSRSLEILERTYGEAHAIVAAAKNKRQEVVAALQRAKAGKSPLAGDSVRSDDNSQTSFLFPNIELV